MTQQVVTEEQIFEAIQKQHKELLRKNSGIGNFDVNQVQEFLKNVAEAGAITEDTEKRSLLLALIRYWSEITIDKSEEVPIFQQLLPLDPSLARREKTHRSNSGLLTNSIRLILIIGGLLSLLVVILVTIGILVLSKVATPYLPIIGALFGIVTLVFMGLFIWQRVRSVEVANYVSTPKLSLQNRHRLLNRVHAFWIKGVLEKSLHDATFIVPGLLEQSDVTVNPWHLVLQQPDQPPRPLPSGTSIIQVYDDANGELLILGEPGAGKTTLLLELARDLLDRAQKDDTYPMPVVFNLSSWAVKRQSLTDWFVEELNTKYQVPHKLGKLWEDDDQILPLLDGLDEVAPEHREACVDTINAYRQEHGLVSIVVCSRSTDYFVQKKRLLLHNAVVLQPLTAQQIDHYLASAVGQSAELRIALHNDLMLRELAKTPLMLTVLTQAYREQPISNLLTAESITMLRRRVFAAYVQRMLQRRSTEIRYSSEQTVHWLAWLAQHLIQHSQTVFYIEHIQPSWLASTRSRRLYELIVRLIVGLVVGLAVGLIDVLISGLIVGLLSGLAIGFGIAIGDSKSNAEIQPTEIVVWSLRRVQWGLVIGLVGALLNGLIVALLNGRISVISNGLIKTLLSTLLSSLISILISILVLRVGSGWDSRMLDEQQRIRPNQGIWYSIRNGLIVGMVNGLGFGLISGTGFGIGFGLFNGLASGLVNGLDFGLYLGLIYGLYSGLHYGGMAFIQHFALRWFLLRAGSIPWEYAHFLDYAAEQILLRKVGGGYIFTHRLLQEYFATLVTLLNSNERV